METSTMYEKVMLEYYFNKMKYLRNQWSASSEKKPLGMASIIDIGGEEHRQYKYIMNGCTKIIYEMLGVVVKELIRLYEIPVRYYDLRTSETDAYYIGEKQVGIDYIDQHIEKNILAFSRTDRYQDVLYIFKEFGIGKRVPQKTLDELMKAAGLSKQCYVSFVEDEAFSEIINHNYDDKDPTRGTNIFSLKQFVEGIFGKDEYAKFRGYANQFTEKVKDYFGFALVRTLKPNAVLNFKKSVRDSLKKLDISETGAIGIKESQREIIESHFFDDMNYEILFGNSDFAQSYLTAEWLYSSLSNAGNIDLTAIAMGYFKAIEQLLFGFIKNHTQEKDGIPRRIYVGKGKEYSDAGGKVLLTDSLVNDKQKLKDFSLASLTGFFGFHNRNDDKYYSRNKDLLVKGINDETYQFIVDTFDGIAGMRNGYFHKENLTDWIDVKQARNKALLVFYILLGAYVISDSDKLELGMVQVEGHDDFYKLCEYLNRKAYETTFLKIPIIYTSKNSDPYGFSLPYHDDFIEYDNYGEPIYSGACLKQFGKNGRIMALDRDAVPEELWEGVLEISRSVPISITPSGAKKQIYCRGKFVAEDEET